MTTWILTITDVEVSLEGSPKRLATWEPNAPDDPSQEKPKTGDTLVVIYGGADGSEAEFSMIGDSNNCPFDDGRDEDCKNTYTVFSPSNQCSFSRFIRHSTNGEPWEFEVHWIEGKLLFTSAHRNEVVVGDFDPKMIVTTNPDIEDETKPG